MMRSALQLESQLTLIQEVDFFDSSTWTCTIEELWGVPLFQDDVEEMRWLKKLANFIRKSPEYATWSKQLKDHLGLSVCSFTKEDSREGGATVDLHHHPLTLVDICTIVLDYLMEKYQGDRTRVNSFLIGEHVMRLHYEMKVGIVPLLKSLHEKYHNEPFPIPMEWVIGDWKVLLSPPYKVRKEIQEKVTLLTQHSLDNVDFKTVLWPR